MTPLARYAQKAQLQYVEIAEIRPEKTESYVGKDLLSYKVPLLSEDGSCSIDHSLQDKPYDLRNILGIKNASQEAKAIEQLANLHDLLNVVQKELKAEWIGIYQTITNVEQTPTNVEQAPVLVKLAYQGSASRAEFPLTEKFAQSSNNSTVGLSGRAVIIQSVAAHQGAYYKCDAQVQSEACLPIFDNDFSRVIGIVDAEAFRENHFDETKLGLLARLCQQLGSHLPLAI